MEYGWVDAMGGRFLRNRLQLLAILQTNTIKEV